MTVLIPVADGSEDIETVTLIDVLRRADLAVQVAAVGHGLDLTLARGSRLTADIPISAAPREPGAIALPGGMPGAEHLSANVDLNALLRAQHDAGRPVAAICAAPAVVLAPLGILDDCPATCYPSFADRLPNHVNERVVRAGHVLTSQGPATAMAFSLALVAMLLGQEPADAIAAQMLVQG